MALDLFVGVTTWNSELFLPHCLESIRRTTGGLKMQIGVADNRSTDRSVEIAVNLTVFAGPFGVRHVVHYAEIGRNRLVYLFAP